MLTWPGRLLRWSVASFWAVIAWLRALPGRIRDGTLALLSLLQNGIRGLISSLLGGIRGLVAPVVRILKMRFEPDPATIPPHKFTIKDRGRTITLFSRQLASMTQSGVSLLDSLEVLASQASDHRMAYLSGDLAGKLSQGYSFSKATSSYPKVFPAVYFHLLRVGEDTGRLVEVVTRLADLLEREEHLIKRVRGALSYPILVICVTAILTLGLFSTVLPSFADFYDDFDVPLPFITALLMSITNWVQTWWFWILLILTLSGVYYLIKYSWSILEYRANLYTALTWIPLVGPILEYSSLARFCWVMELTQDSGLDIVRSLKLACLASGSPILEIDSNRLSKGIVAGQSLSELLRDRPETYPHILHQMVTMGEETSLDGGPFERAGAWFEQEVEVRISNSQAALEPLLMGFISIIVGTIVLAVFLPLYGLLDKLSV